MKSSPEKCVLSSDFNDGRSVQFILQIQLLVVHTKHKEFLLCNQHKPPTLDAKQISHNLEQYLSPLEMTSPKKTYFFLSHYSNRCLVCCGCLRGEFGFSGGHLPLQRPVPSNAALHERLPLSVRCLIATDPRRDNWVSLVPSHHRQCILTDKKEVCVGLCRVLQCLDPRTDH